MTASNTSAITSPTLLSRFPMLRQVREEPADLAGVAATFSPPEAEKMILKGR